MKKLIVLIGLVLLASTAFGQWKPKEVTGITIPTDTVSANFKVSDNSDWGVQCFYYNLNDSDAVVDIYHSIHPDSTFVPLTGAATADGLLDSRLHLNDASGTGSKAWDVPTAPLPYIRFVITRYGLTSGEVKFVVTGGITDR